MSDPVAIMTGVFDGFVLEGENYTFPDAAESYAGVANEAADIYPLVFPDGGKIKFTASAPPNKEVNVKFRFEKNPYPDTEPSFELDPVTVSGSDLKEYEVEIPPQDSEKTYSSFLLYLVERDITLTLKDKAVTIIQGEEEEEETPVFDFIPKPKLGAITRVGGAVRYSRLKKTRCY